MQNWEKKFFTYIVRCSDNSLYTGFTTNLEKRIETHNSGKWAKYTRGRTPVKLVYFEELSSESRARKREYELKQFSKKQKESLSSLFKENNC